MKMCVFKCLRTRLVILTLILALIWTTFYYFFRSSPKEITYSNEMVSLKGDNTVLNIAVYYECLCPDSRSFFVKELLPVVERIPHLLTIDFIPYGKAETTVIGPSKYSFKCQHGPPECLGNKIHSCALTKIEDDLTRTKVLTCMISGRVNPEDSGKKCAQEYNLDWNSILECAEGPEGDEFLKKSGERTHSLVPRVTFIPTVLLNNKLGNQAAILKDLWKQVCLAFKQMEQVPKECTSL